MGGNPSLATYFPTNPISKYLKYFYTANNPYPKEREKLDNAKDGSDYSKIHEEYHARFRRLAKVFDYYDIFLVDIDTGNVLYTVKKEVDFGADLISGPFSDTGLAKAFQAVRKSRDPMFVTAIDFEKYKPSYGNAAAFVATTVFDGDKFIGALIIQLPPDRIDQIMNAHNEWEKVGLGKTGEAILIGPDRVMRSTPRFFIEDPEKYLQTVAQQGVSPQTIALIKSSGSPMLDQKINTPAAENALAGKTGTAPLIDYRGVPVLSSFQPIKLGDFEWGLIAKMDQAEIFKGVNDLARRLLVMAAILIPLIAFFSSWIARKFLTPIRRLIAATHQVEAGNTEVEVKVDSTDEFGQLSQSFNQMARTLTQKEQTIQTQIGENNRLLLNILPPKAAERLKNGELEVVDSFANVTVLFADIEGLIP
jgi:HAMP domain-containing protein